MAFPNLPSARTSRPRRLLAWYVAAALALAAVLPALGMVLRTAAPGLVTVEICSAAGMHTITLAAADVPGGRNPAAPDNTPHCPLCAAPAGPAGILPAGPLAPVAVAGNPPRIPAAGTVDLPATRFQHALSRGPPLLA